MNGKGLRVFLGDGVSRSFYGKGSFVDPHTLQVVRPTGEELALEGDKILVATGSSPIRPPEFPFHIPEVSMVGETEESLAARDVDFVVGRANYLDVLRGEMVGERLASSNCSFACPSFINSGPKTEVVSLWHPQESTKIRGEISPLVFFAPVPP